MEVGFVAQSYDFAGAGLPRDSSSRRMAPFERMVGNFGLAGVGRSFAVGAGKSQ